MRMLVAVVILVGCDQPGPRNGPAPSAPVGRPARPALAPDTGPPTRQPSPPTLSVPPGLAAAPAWIGRHFSTGMIRSHSTLTTWTLRRAGEQALLTIDEQVANNGMTDQVATWSAKQTRQLLGTAKTARTRTTLTLSDGTENLILDCFSSVVSAAEAGAVRKPSRRSEECGDRGHWAPARSRGITVLRCREPGAGPEDSASDEPDLRFAQAPGVEYLYVNDDCTMQGGGWRAIAKDGGVAPPR